MAAKLQGKQKNAEKLRKNTILVEKIRFLYYIISMKTKTKTNQEVKTMIKEGTFIAISLGGAVVCGKIEKATVKGGLFFRSSEEDKKYNGLWLPIQGLVIDEEFSDESSVMVEIKPWLLNKLNSYQTKYIERHARLA